MAELCHHGILGMKWGVRKFQNKDGSLTAAGRKRYDTDIKSAEQRVQKAKADAKEAKRAMQREARNILYNDYRVFKLSEIGGGGIRHIAFTVTAFHVASLLRVLKSGSHFMGSG